MRVDWPEIVSGIALALMAHVAMPHGPRLGRWTLEIAPSVHYERYFDRNGWSWKDLAWRTGATAVVEITLHH